MKRMQTTRAGFLVSLLVVLPLCVFFSGFAYAGDPGIPDTVRFEPWGTYIPCPPCTGHAVVPFVMFNDEPLIHLEIPLSLAGPITFEKVEFTGRVQPLPFVSGDTLWWSLLALTGTSPVWDSAMPPGNGIAAYLYFSLNDTGVAKIDKGIVPAGNPFYHVVGPLGLFLPVFVASEYHIVPQDNPPGDVNQNGGVDLADVVYLINYLFRDGPAPAYPPCADPNIDCWVSLTDVVYLINYLFRSGPEPQPGCAY